MNAVFLDTVGMIATWDRRDQWHAAAEAAFQQLLHLQRHLVTTPLILWECGNSAARCPYRSRVNALRRYLIQETALIEPTSSEIEAAWMAYDRGEAAQAGIVDQVSFAVMRRLG